MSAWCSFGAELMPFLLLGIADLETRLVDLTGCNRDNMANLRAIAQERP